MITIVETTWVGKRDSHSWITCVSRTKEAAVLYVANQTDSKAAHHLSQVDATFPVFIVDVPHGYRHIPVAELQALLKTAPLGPGNQILFDVHCFRKEYRWVPGPRDLTASEHLHVSNESLLEYRAGKGVLHELLHDST